MAVDDQDGEGQDESDQKETPADEVQMLQRDGGREAAPWLGRRNGSHRGILSAERIFLHYSPEDGCGLGLGRAVGQSRDPRAVQTPLRHADGATMLGIYARSIAKLARIE